jgi:hypothetical protein
MATGFSVGLDCVCMCVYAVYHYFPDVFQCLSMYGAPRCSCPVCVRAYVHAYVCAFAATFVVVLSPLKWKHKILGDWLLVYQLAVRTAQGSLRDLQIGRQEKRERRILRYCSFQRTVLVKMFHVSQV